MVYEKYVKRGCDVILSSAGIVILSPVLLGLACWIKTDSPGPVLFRQRRCGQGDSYFDILKFRSMRTVVPYPERGYVCDRTKTRFMESG